MLKFKLGLLSLLYSSLSWALIVSPNPVSGVINLDSNSSTIYFTNDSNLAAPMSLSLSSGSGFALSVDRCSGRTLQKNQSCYILVLVNDSSLPSGTSSVNLLNNSSLLASLSRTKIQGSGSDSLIVNSSSIDFELIPKSGLSKSKKMTITNTGKTSFVPVLENISSNVQIVLNRCTSLSPGKSCDIMLALKTASMSLGSISENFSVKPNASASPIAISIIGTLASEIYPTTFTTPVKQIESGSEDLCIVDAVDKIWCWGTNYSGIHGQGHVLSSSVAKYVDLGKGYKASKLAMGQYAACAMLSNGRVKCWGHQPVNNERIDATYGLPGNFSRIGDDPNEMGDNLPYFNLGTSSVNQPWLASDIWGSQTQDLAFCVKIKNRPVGQDVKCWGSNFAARLNRGSGEGSVNSDSVNNSYYNNVGAYVAQPLDYIGDDVNELGNNLPFLNLGTDSVSKIVFDQTTGCGLFSNNLVKCWGLANGGRLGLNGSNPNLVKNSLYSIYGDDPVETIPNLPFIDLGDTVKDISMGIGHRCAHLTSNDVKCWGIHLQLGVRVALGSGETVKNSVGDLANEMGSNLPPVLLGTGKKAKNMIATNRGGCAVRDDDTVVCWGRNTRAEIGNGLSGGSYTWIGDDPAELGNNLIPVSLGSTVPHKLLRVGYVGGTAVYNSSLTELKGWGNTNLGGSFDFLYPSGGDTPGYILLNALLLSKP